MNEPNNLIRTRKRLLIILLSIAFLFFALAIRLCYIQIFMGSELRAKGAEQWYRDLPMKAPRGKILDVNGEVLADNRDVYSIYVRPKAVKEIEGVVASLSINLDMDKDKLFENITKSKVSEITIKRNVDKDKADKIREGGYDGVYFTVDSKRNYPMDNFLSQIIGFTNIDNVGQNGLEGYYDKYLKGVDGFAYTSTDIKGQELENNVTRYVPAIAGCDLMLTIDRAIQAFAESAVVSATTEWNAKSASMVVMNAKTGGVAAMANYPSFDLNNPPRDNIEMLNALSKNKMIVDVYEPGSTFKIFTTATALTEGVVSDSDRFYCNGKRMVDSQSIKCWRSIGHGSQTLVEGVKNSCNCVFMDLALRLGTKKLYNGLHNFGFGAKTNIDFYGESKGILMNEKTVKNVDLARIGFGQAVAVTPLQLANGVSSVVNGGTLYEPYFVSNITSPQGEQFYNRQPKKVGNPITPAVSEKMRLMLEAVVSEGSGKKAQVPGFRVGGKTGTAQKYENGHIAQGKYISSFVGFAPAENPEYVVLMIVDEPGPGAYYGSIIAAPYAGKVLTKIFEYKGTRPSPTTPIEYVEMPNIIGLSIEEAQKLIKEAGLIFELAGDNGAVTSTLPIPGTQVPKGDVVLIRLNE